MRKELPRQLAWGERECFAGNGALRWRRALLWRRAPRRPGARPPRRARRLPPLPQEDPRAGFSTWLQANGKDYGKNYIVSALRPGPGCMHASACASHAARAACGLWPS
jgi:hypothetical protein